MSLWRVFAAFCAIVIFYGVKLLQHERYSLLFSLTETILREKMDAENKISNRFNNGHDESCSSSWGVFRRGESMLTETQIIQRPNPPPPFDVSTVDKSFEHLFIDPASNFAFCAIEKIACSQWQTVLRNVMHNRTKNGYEMPDYFIGRASQYRHGIEKIQEIFESPTSTVVVMVRDPLARLASVYLNKCFSDNCTGWHCLPRYEFMPTGHDRLVPGGYPITFRHALDWLLQDKVNVSTINPHWSLQSERCGMHNGGLEKYFSIVGLMTKENLNEDAACIMERAGISRFNVAPNLAGNGTFWSEGGIWKEDRRKETEEDVLRKLFTPETARQVMKKFQKDYDTFQLPEPSWVEHATGEWMDTTDHHKCV